MQIFRCLINSSNEHQRPSNRVLGTLFYSVSKEDFESKTLICVDHIGMQGYQLDQRNYNQRS